MEISFGEYIYFWVKFWFMENMFLYFTRQFCHKYSLLNLLSKVSKPHQYRLGKIFLRDTAVSFSFIIFLKLSVIIFHKARICTKIFISTWKISKWINKKENKTAEKIYLINSWIICFIFRTYMDNVKKSSKKEGQNLLI